MPGSVVIAGLSPHPPIIIPEVGQGEEQGAINTVLAMDRLGREFAQAEIDALIVITPHGPVFSDVVSVTGIPILEGDFGYFGSKVGIRLENDMELSRAIVEDSKDASVEAVALDKANLLRYGISPKLDHGVLVPLYYLKKHGFEKPVVVINIGFLSYFDLYTFGRVIARAASRLGRKIGILASGDLSHRLAPDGPGGFNEQGKAFDNYLVDKLKTFSVEDILLVSPSFVEDAGECGLRPISIMLGALDESVVESQVLSYEGPFGVGYCVAIFRPMDWGPINSRIPLITGKRQSYPVSLARKTVEAYVTEGSLQELIADVPNEFRKRSGVFVSIHKEGSLRGCIGTIEPATGSIAEEIVQNAISAATEDPRFAPVTLEELGLLDYSVDILSEPTRVAALSDLDPKKYGVICVKGYRKGLLLPDLPGVDTVSEQLSIAKKKAGISPSDSQVKIYRFTVSRYH